MKKLICILLIFTLSIMTVDAKAMVYDDGQTITNLEKKEEEVRITETEPYNPDATVTSNDVNSSLPKSDPSNNSHIGEDLPISSPDTGQRLDIEKDSLLNITTTEDSTVLESSNTNNQTEKILWISIGTGLLGAVLGSFITYLLVSQNKKLRK